MNTCAVCGSGRRRGEVCDWCLEIVDGASQYHPDDLMLVVDASCSSNADDMRAGGGIVLARRDEHVLSLCPVEFYGTESGDCELEVVERAMMLAPGVVVWAGSTDAIARAMAKYYSGRFDHSPPRVRWLPPQWRNPLHNVAHRLANIARTRGWRAYAKLVVPRGRRAA